MAEVDFDKYVDDYRDIINRVSSISGEQFEYFIQLRLKLMKSRVVATENAPEQVRILDFGCGSGSTEAYLKESFPDALIFGVDASPESIRAAQTRKLDGVTFIHSDTAKLPFPDDFFDIIYSNGTYHHIDPLLHETYLMEMFRICSCGGSLFIFENNPGNPLMMRAMRNNPFDMNAIAIHPQSLQELSKRSGFINKELCYYFFFPKFLRALRFSEKWLSKIPLGAQYFCWSVK